METILEEKIVCVSIFREIALFFRKGNFEFDAKDLEYGQISIERIYGEFDKFGIDKIFLRMSTLKNDGTYMISWKTNMSSRQIRSCYRLLDVAINTLEQEINKV